MKLILEPRYLFDASIAPVAKHLHHQNDHHDGATHAEHTHNSTAPAAISTHETHTAVAPQPPHQILFVDPRVANWQTLAASVGADVKVVVLDPNKDGLAQVTKTLAKDNNVTAINFLTYGQPGQMELGSTTVTDSVLAANAHEIASWSKHLAPNADILIWGCDVAQGTTGQTFVQDLHTLTGAQVAASTDATGALALGGDWTLEATTGHIASANPFSTAAIAAYDNVLDTPLPTVAFSGVPSSVLLGNTFSETVSFTNAASSGVGYGPFIDVFVPTDSAQNVTLSSATYFGQSLTVSTVTLSSSVAGHTGTLGADHPLALDSSRNPLFVQAPSGYVAGDTLYVITLPFGSYTPGEPAANVTLNFSVANTSELSSSHSNQPLNITAVGGFQYGADALNDPTTDPSIRGTGASASASDGADGAVVAANQISLINVQATTDLHEGETATGPDYPFNYVVTLTPAPVTTGDAITNFNFTFDLPGQVEYTGGSIAIGGPGNATGTATFHAGSAAPGGTVTVDFTSLSASGGATTISIPVYVPMKDASGANILNSTTGAAQTITTNPLYSYSGTWNPVSGSLDHGASGQSFSGDSSTNPISASFIAKSLAIQITDNDSGSVLAGGQVITYTINFQVSDYFDLNNLNLQAALTDGLTLLAPGDSGYVAPTLTITREGTTTSGISFTDVSSPQSFTFTAPGGSGVNNQTVAESGSNSYWSYSRDDGGSTGVTTLDFAVGALLTNQFGPGAVASVLEGSGGTGATQGTITFKAKTLDWYTNTLSQDSLRENDNVGASVTTTGTSADVVTVVSSTVTPTGHSVSDASSLTDAVPQGSLALSIVAINGSANGTATPSIQPGDTVTYAMTYTLTSGDYGNFSISSYLPLPIFKSTDPNSDGSSVASYSADNADTYPTVGQYKLVSAPSGGAVSSVATSGTSNGVTFTLGTLNDPTNTTGQQVVIYFTVKASDLPFADGLKLTDLSSSSYTSAKTSVQTSGAIQQVQLEEPELAIKTGIVSVVGNDGTTPVGTFTADSTNNSNGVTWTTPQDTTPSDAFNAAETGGSPFTGSTSPLSADNLDVSGANGGDTARVVSTILNQGHGTAYDVTINGTLPTGYTTSDVSNFQVVNAAGSTISYTGTEANYFSGTGIKLSSSLAANTAYYVVYDITLHSTQTADQAITPSSSIINWANYAGGVAANKGFVNGSTPLGESANAITDNATINTVQYSPVLSIVGESNNTTPNPNTPAQTNTQTSAQAVIGEVVRMHAYVTIPEGSNSTNLDFALPAGLQYLNDGTATIAFVSNDGALASSSAALSSLTAYQDTNSGGSHYVNPVTGTTTANDAATFAPTDALPSSIVDTTTPNHVKINLGTLTDSTESTTPNYVIIEFNAVVQNVAGNVNATALATNFTATNGTSATATSNTTTVTVKEPAITITKTASAINTSTDTITYNITLTNSGDATAYNVVLDDPAATNEHNISYVSASGSGSNTDTTTSTDVHDSITSLGVGQSEMITYTVQVTDPSTRVTNDTATAIWSSLPSATTFHGSSSGSGDSTTGERDFNSGSNPPNNYTANLNSGIGTVSGRVWEDTGGTQGAYNAANDTPLGGLTITATTAGADGILGNGDDITFTTTTASDGTYSFSFIPDGPTKISLNTNGTAGGPLTTQTLIYDPQQNSQTSNPAAAKITSSNGAATGNVDFAFQVPTTTVTFVEPNDTAASGAAVAVNNTLVVTSGTYTSASVAITGSFVAGEDVLTANTTGTSITTSYNAATGVLTLSGSDTAADYQTVLRSVQYYNNSDTPTTSQRTVTYTILNSGNHNPIGVGYVNITPDNDSPILSSSGSVSAIEDSSSPSGAVGVLVQNLVSGLITDPDGPFAGIAITQVKTSFTLGSDTITGNWFYSTNNGASWSTITIGSGQALDLKADANTRIYFQPTTANFNGSLPGAITFRAWDGTNSATNGSLVTLPGSPGTGLSSTGAGAADNSSYSAQVDMLPVAVANVNDAPTASGTATLGSAANAGISPPGDTVSNLFTSHFSDPIDNQRTNANPTGSVSNTLAGIAIIGNNSTALQGQWEYSTNGGASWTVLPSVSDTSAVELPVTAKIRFLPTSTFTGTPGDLVVRVIDNSSGAVTAATGVNVTSNGGITPISATTATLTTNITAGGVPPIIPPTPTIPPSIDNLSGSGRGDSTPYFEQPLIPQIWLIGSSGSHFVIAEQHAIIPVPPNLFEDTDPSQHLTFDAKMPGGGPLPSWLNFDSQTLIFAGTPPESAHGTISIMIVARDTAGNEAMAEFRILVGRDQEDLMTLLRPRAKPIKVNASPAPATDKPAHTKPHHHHKAHKHNASDKHADIRLPDKLVEQKLGALPGGRTAFSQQMKAAGPLGKRAEAKDLLNALAYAASENPSAENSN